MPTLDEMLAQGGELDPALKRSRLEAMYGPGYKDFITPEGNFEIPVGSVAPQAQGPLAGPQGPAPFKKGALQVGMDLFNAGGMLSQAVGLEDWSNALYEKAQDYDQRIQAIPSRIGSVEDIHSMKDAAIYGYERIAENVPMLASLMLPGGAVSAGVRGIGMTARAAKLAGWSAAAITDLGLQTGESVDIAKRAGQDPNDVRVIGSGIGKAALDFIPFFTLATKLGVGPMIQKELMKTLVEKGFLKRAAGHIGTLIATEVPTEVMQEGINIALDRSLQQKTGELTDEEISQLKNAAAGALAVSIGLGAGAGVMSPRAATEAELHSGGDAAIPQAQNPITPGMQVEPNPIMNVAGQMGPVLAGEYAEEFNPFSYSSAFDAKTGEMTVTGKEYRKALIQNGQEIKYDPFQDKMVGTEMQPALTPTRTGWYFDPNAGGFIYDRGKGKVEFSEAGFTAVVDSGPIGTFPTPEAAMAQAEKFAYDGEPVTAIDEGGDYVYDQQDASKRLALTLKQQGQLTPTESAIVAIEDAKPESKVDQSVVQADEQAVLAQLDPGVQKLLEVRMEFLGNKDNYRTTDQQMKNSARSQLEKLDARIGSVAQKLGIANPLKADSHVDSFRETEQVFEDRAKKADQPKYPNLSETEASLLDALEEKEREPGAGLTQREYEKLERLIAKRGEDIGVPAAERVKVSDADIDAIMQETKKRYRREYKSVKKSQDPSIAGAPLIQAEAFDSTPRDDEQTVLSGRGEPVGTTYKEVGQFVGEPLDGAVKFFPTQEAATQHVIDEHLAKRSDWKREVAGRERDLPGEKVRAVRDVSPARKALEIEMIKAVRKIYDGLLIKPRVDFAASDNRTVFPEGSSLQRSAERYRSFIQMRDGGRVFMLLDKFQSVLDAELTFVHEVFAHFGLRAAFGPKELEQILREVAKARQEEILRHRSTYAERGQLETPEGPITLMQAEEFIASKFEQLWRKSEETNKSFTDKIMGLFRRFMRKLGISKWSDKDLIDVLRDVGAGLRAGVTPNNRGGYWWDPRMAQASAGAVLGRDTARIAEGDINSVGEVWRAKSLLGILTPLQVAERFNVDGAKQYIETTMKWWARKRTLTNGATDVAESWQKIPKKSAERLAGAIFEIANRSDELNRRLLPEELRKIFDENNVAKDGTDLYEKIDTEFKAVLDNLENGLKRAVLRQASGDAEKTEKLLQLWSKPDKSEFLNAAKDFMGNLELGGRLSDIENQIKHLRDRNYFPYSRFGEYALTIRAKRDVEWKGDSYRGPTADKRGQVVHFETFESAAAQKERFESLRREFPEHSFRLNGSVVSEEEFSFLGMPPALLDLIRDSVKLSDQQAEDLKELFYLRSPGRAFLRHLVKRRGTAGYSQDALRVFSSYMMNSANHIARIEFNPDLTDHLTTMKKFAEEHGNVAGLVSNYFQKHHSYLMNPANDLAQLRALGFLWYLGFNVKSAMVNLSQVPMVAYPYLASVYGDVKAVGALSNAYKRVVDWRRGKSVLSKEMETFVQRGIAEGFLDESRATELAGLAEGGALHRILPFDKSTRVLNQTSYYASYLFRHAEKFNREVVFLASLELNKARGVDGETAFKAARKAVQTTMFEYAKWNRPQFMRGKKSVFFLFWNYMQHLNYLAFGGEGRKTAIRVNLMLLVAAGLQGLPFAENILDLIDWGSTEVKETLGSEDPRTDLRADIRQLAQTITERPDLVMHGLGRNYGLGAFHLLELLGVPVPQVDVSGSLSAGQPIPGIHELVEPTRDPDKKLGSTIVAALGPVAGIGYTFWKTMMSQDPDQWKTWERAMPNAMRVASQGIRRASRDEETFRGGGAIVKFDPLNAEHRAELIANALGFAPSRVSQSYELRSAQEDLRQYWTVRRAMVMENFAWSMLSDDLDARADSLEALKNFNRDAPSPKLRLTAEQIQASLRQRTKLRSLREQGIPNEKAFQPLYAEQAQLYGGAGK